MTIASDPDDGFAARVRALMERLRMPSFTPMPPDDAPAPPRHWAEADEETDDA